MKRPSRGGPPRSGGGTARQLPPQAVQIESIAAGGEGVGRLADGRVAFVHRTAPGDLAEVAVIEQHPRWTRGMLLRLVEPSGERRDAPCIYYPECGGCTLEHMRYEAQLRAKARIVADALTRIGNIPIDPPEVVASPAEFGYRNRVSFALRRLGAGEVVAGFHALGNPDRIVDMDGRCLLPEAPISKVWSRLREVWGTDASRLPSGEQLRLTLRATSEGSVSLLVEGGYSRGRPEELIAAVPALEAVWHRPGRAGPELIAGTPGLPESWGHEEVELSGAAFLQVNRLAAALLEDHVFHVVGDVEGQRVVDAYCGVGLHARRLARAGASVVGIELDAEAVAAARAASPVNARFEQGPVEELLPSAMPADLLILNPPRAGVATAVLEQIDRHRPSRLVYISCNPATLARDLRRLRESYRLESLRSFDLFPQTAHVETVVVLSAEPAVGPE